MLFWIFTGGGHYFAAGARRSSPVRPARDHQRVADSSSRHWRCSDQHGARPWRWDKSWRSWQSWCSCWRHKYLLHPIRLVMSPILVNLSVCVSYRTCGHQYLHAKPSLCVSYQNSDVANTYMLRWTIEKACVHQSVLSNKSDNIQAWFCFIGTINCLGLKAPSVSINYLPVDLSYRRNLISQKMQKAINVVFARIGFLSIKNNINKAKMKQTVVKMFLLIFSQGHQRLVCRPLTRFTAAPATTATTARPQICFGNCGQSRPDFS